MGRGARHPRRGHSRSNGLRPRKFSAAEGWLCKVKRGPGTGTARRQSTAGAVVEVGEAGRTLAEDDFRFAELSPPAGHARPAHSGASWVAGGRHSPGLTCRNPRVCAGSTGILRGSQPHHYGFGRTLSGRSGTRSRSSLRQVSRIAIEFESVKDADSRCGAAHASWSTWK